MRDDAVGNVQERANRILKRMLNTPPRPHKDEPKREKGKKASRKGV